MPVVTVTSYEVDDGADDGTWAVRTHAAAHDHLSVLRAAYDERGACSVTLLRAAQGQALLGAVVGECKCYGTRVQGDDASRCRDFERAGPWAG
jgi:hypothetical protein